jgi:hypothetical protein
MISRPGNSSSVTKSVRARIASLAIPLLALAALCATLAISGRAASSARAANPTAEPQGDAGNILPVVLFATWRDPNEGAFTVSIPLGWQTSGGAIRRSAVDITQTVRTATADGRVKLFLNDADIVPREVPNDMTAAAGQREGQTVQAAWGGPLLLTRFQSGQEFAGNYITGKLCHDATITGGAPLEDETGKMNAYVKPFADAANYVAHASVGEVFYHCGDDFGYVTATTMIVGPHGAGASIWVVWQISGFTVKKEVDGPYAMYILHTMDSTFKLDPAWEARSQKDTQELTIAVTKMQNAISANLQQQAAARARHELAGVIGGNNSEVTAGWEIKTRGAPRKDNPAQGSNAHESPVWTSHAADQTYTYYWTRDDGSIIATTNNVPPTSNGGGWRPMAKP